jgi:LPXTG-motif cell wall-anchored protein
MKVRLTMKKSYLKLIAIYSIFILTVVLFLPTGKTGADTAAKEIDLATLPEAVLFNVSNLKPGDLMIRELTIQNNGNKNFTYNFDSRKKSGSDLLYNQLQLEVKDNSTVLYNGSLGSFTGLNPRSLLSHSQEKITLTVEFPFSSGNEFQGLGTEVEFILYAEGRNNPPDPPDDGDPPDPPDDGDPPDPPDDGDPPDPPDDGDPPDPPDDGDPPDPPDDGDPPDPPDDNEPPGTNEPPSNNPTPTKPADPPSKDTGSLPQTGEENPIFIILSGFFISLAGLGLLLIKKSIIPNPFKRG